MKSAKEDQCAPTSKSRALLYQMVAKGLGLVVQLISVKFYLQQLGTSYETFLLATIYIGYLSLLDFGFSVGAQKRLTEARAESADRRLFQLLKGTWMVYCGVACLGILVSAVAYSASAISGNQAVEFALPLLAFLLLNFVILMLGRPILIYCLATERFTAVAKSDAATSLTTPLISMAALYFWKHPGALAMGATAGTLLGQIVLLYGAELTRHRRKLGSLPIDRLLMRDMGRLGVSSYPISIATLLGATADRLLVGVAGRDGNLAGYAVSGRLSEIAHGVLSPFTTTTLPELTRLSATDAEAFRSAYVQNIRAAVALGCSLIVAPCAFAGSLLALWLGPELTKIGISTQAAGITALLMAVYRMFELAFGTMTMGYFAKGFAARMIPFAVFNAMATLALTVPAYQTGGIIGVASMNAFIGIVQLVPQALYARRALDSRLSPADILGPVVRILLITVVVAAPAIVWIDPWLSTFAPLASLPLALATGLTLLLSFMVIGLCPVPSRLSRRFPTVFIRDMRARRQATGKETP